MFYSTNTFEGDRIGTYIVVDKMLDPYTPAGHPMPVVGPPWTRRSSVGIGTRRASTGTPLRVCYFREGDWQYVMYSGNCYLQPTYYIGYARAKTDETDLTKIKFEKGARMTIPMLR